jgi:hypothetical protein
MKIEILSRDNLLGVIQFFDLSKDVESNIKLKVSRMILDKRKIQDVFQSSITPEDQLQALQIVIYESNRELMRFSNVWLRKSGKLEEHQDWVTIEGAEFDSDVISGYFSSYS